MSWVARDLDEDRLAGIRHWVETYGFWEYVDSSSHAYAARCNCEDGTADHECARWDHARDGEWCLAANSMRRRCSKRAAGSPFCDFHLERAWRALYAAAHGQLIAEANLEREFTRRVIREQVGVEAATVEDARRVMAQQPSRIYFYAVGNVVKIGRSTNPEQRVRNFGTTLAPEGVDPRSGELLGTMPGGSAVEHHLHQRFRPQRVVGEWFRLTDEIRAAIDELLPDDLADTG